MKKLICVSLCVLFVAVAANAVEEKYGPFKQYDGYHWDVGTFIIPTINTWSVYSPVSGKSFTFGGWGGQEIEVSYPCPDFVDSYLYIDSPFNPATGYLHMIEVIAYDLKEDYDSSGIPKQRGFTYGDPEIRIPGLPSYPGKWMSPPVTKYYFTGLSGTKYGALSVEQCPIYELQSRMAGFNVSKITETIQNPNNMVYIVEGAVPASDFTPFVFSFDYKGLRQFGDPNWRGPADAEYPYQHEWKLNITQWNPSVPKVSDVDIEAPVVIPGYVKIIPPSNWIAGPWYIGRYSYVANPNNEITAGGGTFGWTIGAKTPYVIPGHAYLTNGGSMVSNIVNTVVVASDSSSCGAWSFFDGDFNKDCVVDFKDFALFAQKWLACSDPTGTGCTRPSL